ncbi:MAG: hypothetical protein AAF485_12215, partial [Chloroflexota bacterium]
MTTHISLIGIDGSGKSTIAQTLTNLIPAELEQTTIAIGDNLWGKTPTEDLFRPNFTPDGQLWSARLGCLFQQLAKSATARRRLYPPLKIIQLVLQEQTAKTLAHIYQPDIIVTDGNLLLSAAGRAINYKNPDTHLPEQLTPAETQYCLNALYRYVFNNQPLPTCNPALNWLNSIPGLKIMRQINLWSQTFNLELLNLPDALIFLKTSPEVALTRLSANSDKLDAHENIKDLSEAQSMYQAVFNFFRQQRGSERAIAIDVTHLTIEEVAQKIVNYTNTLNSPKNQGIIERGMLGQTGLSLSDNKTVLKKALTYNYLVRYTLCNLNRGSAQELTFPLSRLGRAFFKEGYSAKTMQAIYQQDKKQQGVLDRLFLNYPLHRAVYHRLQCLNKLVEAEIKRRLEPLPEGEILTIFTAPSGYGFDLFQPLQRIKQQTKQALLPIHIVASDLDPEDDIEDELRKQAYRAGVDFSFIKGDLTSPLLGRQFQKAGPFDMVLFIGLSCWITKPALIAHLKQIKHCLLTDNGSLFIETFTPNAFALSGKYVGYKANYYTPAEFTTLLTYCGFETDQMIWQSDPEEINHVGVIRPQEIL